MCLHADPRKLDLRPQIRALARLAFAEERLQERAPRIARVRAERRQQLDQPGAADRRGLALLELTEDRVVERAKQMHDLTNVRALGSKSPCRLNHPIEHHLLPRTTDIHQPTPTHIHHPHTPSSSDS